MNKLYKFNMNCGRMGDLSGMFVLDEEEQERLENLFGREVYYGEVLGKHSEIYGELERCEVTLVTDDQDFLNKAKELGIDLNVGICPLDYVEEEEDD